MAKDKKETYAVYRADYTVIPNKAEQKYTMPYDFKIKQDEISIMDDIARIEAKQQLKRLHATFSLCVVTLDKLMHERNVPLD